MRRADRLFQLVQVLRTRRSCTAAGVARELGVSKRTVYRDIKDLVASGVPIRGEAGVGYRLERAYALPPMRFTPEEIEALVLGARMVEAWADPALAAAARAAVLKVEAVLPDGLKPLMGATALFAPSRSWAPAAFEGLGTLRQAIAARRVVRFDYERSDGARSTRAVRPLALYFWGNRWSLGAWCELRQDYRSFRPDRMRSLVKLEQTFDGADGVGLDGFMASIRARDGQ